MRFAFAEKLRILFSRSAHLDSFYEDLEDLLVEADIGALTAADLVSSLKKNAREKRPADENALITLFKEMLRPWLRTATVDFSPSGLTICLVCGVNGVGKTTTIGKLSSFFRSHNGIHSILFSAADTFRAAASEQLTLLGERLGVKVITQQQGADPGAVVFDSIDSALSKKADLLLIDTSGRMHNKEHLVKELSKMDKIIKGKAGPDSTYHKLLVIDATTGQNARRQAEVFHEALGIDSIILAKYDSTAKGGVVVSIGKELEIPFSFICNGEKMTDIEPFDPAVFLAALFESS